MGQDCIVKLMVQIKYGQLVRPSLANSPIWGLGWIGPPPLIFSYTKQSQKAKRVISDILFIVITIWKKLQQ